MISYLVSWSITIWCYWLLKLCFWIRWWLIVVDNDVVDNDVVDNDVVDNYVVDSDSDVVDSDVVDSDWNMYIVMILFWLYIM